MVTLRSESDRCRENLVPGRVAPASRQQRKDGERNMKPANNQKQNIDTLLTLIKENPGLEILPMVDSDIVESDEYGWWVGDWGFAEIDEYWCGEGGDERIYFKSEDFESL